MLIAVFIIMLQAHGWYACQPLILLLSVGNCQRMSDKLGKQVTRNAETG